MTNVMRRGREEIESTQTKLRFDGIRRHTFWTVDTDQGSEKPKEIRFGTILIEECVDRYKAKKKEPTEQQFGPTVFRSFALVWRKAGKR